ncbi:MAG: sialate O-acetylesterase [Planctomycetia bacterium]|nr:sialate O-acetylesterase [Planctomycetia bacterium]
MLHGVIRSATAALVFLVASAGVARANVRLPAIFSNGMVLQRSARVPVWGWAKPGEQVRVAVDGRTAEAQADANGRWRVALDLEDAGPGPFEMTVRGDNTLTIANVAVGEVWLAVGQSNMEWPVAGAIGGPEAVAASENPLVRQFSVAGGVSAVPLEQGSGKWAAASPQTTGKFSAVGYFFARRLNEELDVPVGVIHAGIGGSVVEAWTSAEALDTVPDLKAAKDRIWKELDDYDRRKASFVPDMKAWIAATGRADDRAADPATFAGPDVAADGWTPIKLPGEIAADGLPRTGIFWLRCEFDAPADLAGVFPITCRSRSVATVYLNGVVVGAAGLEQLTGAGLNLVLSKDRLPAGTARPGRNVLAIRVVQPATVEKVQCTLAGPWRIKLERGFEDPTEPAPVPPQLPPGGASIAAHLYQGMIHPLVPYGIRGAIWYQGEHNAARGYHYRTAFPLLITDWRKRWNQGDFPFYFCQLPGYGQKLPQPREAPWAELRESQTLTLSLPNTGQAVLLDLGESADIHPRNKQPAGERLARIALARDYGKKIPYSGPRYESLKIAGGKAVVTFTDVAGGLVALPLPATYDVETLKGRTAPLVRTSPGSEVEGFAVCGADKVWHWADATIEGHTVIVSSAAVSAPVAVRYAWADNPTCNLANDAGLLAAPFRTDDFPAVTASRKY